MSLWGPLALFSYHQYGQHFYENCKKLSVYSVFQIWNYYVSGEMLQKWVIFIRTVAGRKCKSLIFFFIQISNKKFHELNVTKIQKSKCGNLKLQTAEREENAPKNAH